MLGDSSLVSVRRSKVFPALILALMALAVTVLIWGPLLDAPFLIDDLTWSAAVYGDDGDFSWARVGKLLWPSDPNYDFQHHFRPLGHLSFALNDRALGYAPIPFRCINFLLLAMSGWLTGIIALRLGASRSCAALATLGVVLHGCSFETLGWIAHRFTLQANVGFLLAMLATLRVAANPQAGLKTLAFCGALALFSKDSMLAALWVLPVAALLFSSREECLRNFRRCTLIVLGLVLLNISLRKLSTGAWIPALTGERDVVQDLSFVHILDSFPEFIRGFATPLTSASLVFLPSMAAGIIIVLAGLSVLAAFIVRPSRSQYIAHRFLIVALATCALMFTVLQVGESLSGARRYHLLACLWLAWLGVGCSRSWRTWVLAAYVLALSVTGWTNARTLNDGLMQTVIKTTRIIEQRLEQLPDSRPVIVVGIPPAVDGLPAFGSRLAHLSMRFRRPLGSVPNRVYGGGEAELLKILSAKALEPREVLVFSSGSNSPRQFTWTPMDVPGNQAAGFKIPSEEGARWPGASGPIIRLQLPSAQSREPGGVLRVSIRYGEQLASWLIANNSTPGSGEELTLDLVGNSPTIVAPMGVDALMRPLMSGKSFPGFIRVDLQRAHQTAPTWSTGWLGITLGL